MTASAARIRANAKYNAKTYERFQLSSRKDERLSDLIDFACSQNFGKSKNDYIIKAIYAQLERDGITIDQLPAEENDSQNVADDDR